MHATWPKANADWRRDADTSHHLIGPGWTGARFWTHEAPEAVADAITALVAAAGGSHRDT
jgi:hypothetical protein